MVIKNVSRYKESVIALSIQKMGYSSSSVDRLIDFWMEVEKQCQVVLGDKIKAAKGDKNFIQQENIIIMNDNEYKMKEFINSLPSLDFLHEIPSDSSPVCVRFIFQKSSRKYFTISVLQQRVGVVYVGGQNIKFSLGGNNAEQNHEILSKNKNLIKDILSSSNLTLRPMGGSSDSWREPFVVNLFDIKNDNKIYKLFGDFFSSIYEVKKGFNDTRYDSSL